MSPVNTRYQTIQQKQSVSSSNDDTATDRPSGGTSESKDSGRAATGRQGGPTTADARRGRSSSSKSSGRKGGLKRQGAIRRKNGQGRMNQKSKSKDPPTSVSLEHGKRAYEQSFNQALEHYQDPKKRRGGSKVSPEEAAHRVAWSAAEFSGAQMPPHRRWVVGGGL